MTKKNLDQHRKPLAIIILICVITIMIAAVYFYRYHSMKILAQMKNWMNKERVYLQNKSWVIPKKQTKTVAVNKEINKNTSASLPIQFEFYETLPAMRVTIPMSKEIAMDEGEAAKNAELNSKSLVKKEKKIVSSQHKFFNAETLKREFARDLNLK